jgi:ribosomal protein S18 acetylase RimI-like enzyme
MAPAEGAVIRHFCLATIREAFGYDYRPDWHADLDELVEPMHGYHPDRRGAFLVARWDGEIAGCGGLRSLITSPPLAERFVSRYGDAPNVGSIWRVYVSPEHRSRGLGSRLVSELELRASHHGYDRLYLHTSARTPRSLAFWQHQGYEPFSHDAGSFDSTVHLDKDVDGSVDLRLAKQPERSVLRVPLGPAR